MAALDTVKITTYPVRVEAGEVWIDVPDVPEPGPAASLPGMDRDA